VILYFSRKVMKELWYHFGQFWSNIVNDISDHDDVVIDNT